MRRVLTLRLDAIGDAILWNGAAGPLRDAFPGANFAAVCRPGCEAVLSTNPFLDSVIVVDPADPSHAAARINAWAPDILLHPVRSREPQAEAIVARSEAPIKIALQSDTANATRAQIADFDTRYTRLVATPEEPRGELDRHADFLRGFGVEAGSILPRVWLTPEDHAEAQAVIASEGFEPAGSIAVFPTARWSYKLYPRWPEALALSLRAMPSITTVLAMGAAEARPGAVSIRDGLAAMTPGVRVVDLSGRTTLRGCMALLGRCRLMASNDTFAVHAACALGVPQAVVVGGGHLGRFLPYDPLTTVATLPLECDGCDWRCRHSRAHCIKDIPPETVALAITLAAGPRPERPRLVTPDGPFDPATPARGHAPGWIRSRTIAITTSVRVPA